MLFHPSGLVGNDVDMQVSLPLRPTDALPTDANVHCGGTHYEVGCDTDDLRVWRCVAMMGNDGNDGLVGNDVDMQVSLPLRPTDAMPTDANAHCGGTRYQVGCHVDESQVWRKIQSLGQ